MLTLLAYALLVPVTPMSSSVAAQQGGEPPVEVWLNRQQDVAFGSEMRVYVRTERDGHMVVLHADPEGRVRVLFPIDPFEDDFIRGGQAYEVRGRQNREAFVSADVPGVGVIIAAYSPDPFDYRRFALDDHWDFRALGEISVDGTAEDELAGLASAMATGDEVIYDVSDYYIAEPDVYRGRYRTYYADYYTTPYYPNPHFYYAPLYTLGHRHRYRSGFSISIGFGSYYGPYYDPFYYDPFHYDPYYCGVAYYSPYRYYNYPTYTYVAPGRAPLYRAGARYTLRNTVVNTPAQYRPRVNTTGVLASATRRSPTQTVQRSDGTTRRVSTASPSADGRRTVSARPTVPTRTRAASPTQNPSSDNGARRSPTTPSVTGTPRATPPRRAPSTGSGSVGTSPSQLPPRPTTPTTTPRRRGGTDAASTAVPQPSRPTATTPSVRVDEPTVRRVSPGTSSQSGGTSVRRAPTTTTRSASSASRPTRQTTSQPATTNRSQPRPTLRPRSAPSSATPRASSGTRAPSTRPSAPSRPSPSASPPKSTTRSAPKPSSKPKTTTRRRGGGGGDLL